MVAPVALFHVDREFVMTYVWENVVDQYVAGEYHRARKSYGLFETIEGMTDEEYASACVCDDEGCHCHN